MATVHNNIFRRGETIRKHFRKTFVVREREADSEKLYGHGASCCNTEKKEAYVSLRKNIKTRAKQREERKRKTAGEGAYIKCERIDYYPINGIENAPVS